MIIRYVYEEGRKFKSTEDLVKEIKDAWDAIELQFARTIYRSITRHLISVIEKKGWEIDYYCIIYDHFNTDQVQKFRTLKLFG